MYYISGVKDSNASEMAQMLKVLAPLQQQILSVLNEWEDHNDLQNFLDIIDMLLTLPSDTPLAKVVIKGLIRILFSVDRKSVV